MKAAAHAVHMCVAEARSSSGASIWSMASWSSEVLDGKQMEKCVGVSKGPVFHVRDVAEKRGRHEMGDCCPS